MKKKKQVSPDTLPLKLVSEELAGLRRVFRETMRHYAQRVDGEILKLLEVVEEAEQVDQVSATRFRDARDMITILRHAKVKSEKGRRRDLKKLESVVEDLQALTQDW